MYLRDEPKKRPGDTLVVDLSRPSQAPLGDDDPTPTRVVEYDLGGLGRGPGDPPTAVAEVLWNPIDGVCALVLPGQATIIPGLLDKGAYDRATKRYVRHTEEPEEFMRLLNQQDQSSYQWLRNESRWWISRRPYKAIDPGSDDQAQAAGEDQAKDPGDDDRGAG